jgi:uncharacterized iron-regulated protein
MFYTLLLSIILQFGLSKDKEPEAFKLFDSKGKEINYDKMLADIAQNDILLFGEYHDNPICHWLQYQVTQDLISLKEKKVQLGFEMFERDVQIVVDEYVSGIIKEDKFMSDSRPWKNYKTDYKPLVQLAVEHNLKVSATNVPRRYASLVFAKGFDALDSLSNQTKAHFPPLPILYDADLSGYKAMLNNPMGGHSNPNLPKAQAIKDACMAWFILQDRTENHLFIHYNGSYHSDNYEGICWYLNQYQPKVRLKTIGMVEQENLKSLSKEHLGKANYILVVNNQMTKTH